MNTDFVWGIFLGMLGGCMLTDLLWRARCLYCKMEMEARP